MGRGGGSFANHNSKPNANFDLYSNSHFGDKWHVYFGDDVNSPTNTSHRIVVIVAKEHIDEGEEIFIRYGRSTRDRMGIVDSTTDILQADETGSEEDFEWHWTNPSSNVT